MRKAIKLSDHFTYRRLGRFVLPSIIMMLFTSAYGIVDGFFVSNYAGKIPYAGTQLVMPFIMIVSAVGFMFGTGGSALVAQRLGEKRDREAKVLFTTLITILFLAGAALSLLGAIFMPQIVAVLGGEGELARHAILYGRISMASMPMFMLQNAFQSFLVAAEKPRLGLAVNIIAGVTNMVLDYFMVAVHPWGVAGAAIATAISETTGALLPFLYFLRPNSSLLRFLRPHYDGSALLKTCTNGLSELLSNVAGPVVSMMYNIQLLRYVGEDGVAAYGAVMSITFIFWSIYFGYAIGSAPLYSWHYAAGTHDELHNLYVKSMRLMLALGILLTVASLLLAPTAARIFIGYDPEVCQLTIYGLRIVSFSFLVGGFAVFGSGFFTALGCGLISAIISVMRTIVFQLSCVIVLPIFFGINGIWVSGVIANVLATALTGAFLLRNKQRLHFG